MDIQEIIPQPWPTIQGGLRLCMFNALRPSPEHSEGCLLGMSKITAIEPQQKNPHRVNIYLDGEFAFGLARITAGWLKVGQELSEEKIASLQAEDASEMAYQKALHFLSYRPRSSAEVRQNLMKRGIPEALVEETVNRLQRAGLVNDQEFARAWVENRNTFQPRSKIGIADGIAAQRVSATRLFSLCWMNRWTRKPWPSRPPGNMSGGWRVWIGSSSAGN